MTQSNELTMTKVACIVATFGPDKQFWNTLATRAIGSIARQTRQPNELHRVHVDQENALHIARNRGAAMSEAEWLIFLDADDVLHERYVEEMLAGEGDVRIPSRENFFWDGRHEGPWYQAPGRTLLDYCHICIGAMIRRDLFLKVGGFEDWQTWEDWHFWLKCWIEGAAMLPCKKAIYQANIRPDSRQFRRGNIDLGTKIRLQMEPLAKAKGLLDGPMRARREEQKRRFGIGAEA